MSIAVAITGASGSLYAQRLLAFLAEAGRETHIILSSHAREVAACETGELRLPEGMPVYDNDSMQVPVVSGSAPFRSMVIVPCSMGTIGRIAYGTSDSVITRAADVFLKEKRQLILVPRETPWNLIQARNVVSVMEAGATLLPAIPSFYSNPATVEEVVDTVVARILDHLRVEHRAVKRWKTPPEEPDAH